MRILQIAPPWEPVPPPAYGGTELVVSLLTEELVRRGHDVTLVASGDSRTRARLIAPFPRRLRPLLDELPAHDVETMDWLYTARALQEAAGDYDIVHNHHGELPMLFSARVTAPLLTTLHGKPAPVFEQILGYYQGYFNCISAAHARQYPVEGCLGVVHHGIDVDTFPFSPQKDGYLLFLSRISEEKGPLEAIEVARRLGLKLVLAGKVSHLDRPFFERQIRPLVDGDQIVFVGEADARMKRELYAAARCVLMPLKWEEPFGLVMVEAMACGTPVIAFRRGSAPELIISGRTGFVVDTLEEMVEAVRQLGEIRPEDCRQHVEHRFSVERMTDRYLALYDQILQLGAPTSLAPAA
jgi:glycosyltransferase involved in cell wall biosynthesis